LVVAGTFADPHEKKEFEGLCQGAPAVSVHYVGFLHGLKKKQALMDADLFCFPSHWENQPVSVIEALAFGLPMVITRLPSVQEMLPHDYSGIADVGNPEQVASALKALVLYSDFELLRKHFTSHFTLQHYLSNLTKVLKSVENGNA
jgi:glycosyltransferase involved in cell wall biosynthesis